MTCNVFSGTLNPAQSINRVEFDVRENVVWPRSTEMAAVWLPIQFCQTWLPLYSMAFHGPRPY